MRTLIALCCFLCVITTDVFAVGTFIPAASRVDMVHDFRRDLIYITQGDSVLRYQVSTATFLPSYVLGGNLKGIDISPDGNALAVANATHDAANTWVYLVDLNTEASTKVLLPINFGEGGTFSVAYGSDGTLLISSLYEGSGWVPLRKYTPVTGAVTILGTITQNTMLVSSGDRSAVGFAEANISDGRFGRYRVADGDVLRKQGYTDGTSWFNYEMGSNGDGTQYAIPTYGGTFFYDVNLSKIGAIGQYAGPQPVGVAYHPVENLVYFPWVTTSEIRIYDTITLTQVGTYDFEDTFSNNGNWAFVQGRTKLSGDGSILMASVTGGVHYHRQYAPLQASDVTASTAQDHPVAITLQGSIGNGGALHYNVVDAPANGSISGTGANLIYTPDSGFSGEDKFRYRVNYGRAWAEASASIFVAPPNRPPLAKPDNAVTIKNRSVVIGVLANDIDFDDDVLRVSAVSVPKHGTASIVNGGALVLYIPKKGFVGFDYFTYTVSDGKGGLATAGVTVRVKNR